MFLGQERKRLRGFTAFELLVVMCIIVLLFALLIPAVNRCREAARRVHCRNNLYQIAIAMHNYEMTHTVLPPGCVNETGPVVNTAHGYHAGWLAQLLPLLDSTAVGYHFDSDYSVHTAPNSELTAYLPAVLRCPAVTGQSEISSYAGCAGGTDSALDSTNDGLLYLNSSVTQTQIRDGMSNTLLAGERIRGDTPNGNELTWLSGTSSTLRHTGIPPNKLNSWIPQNGDPRTAAELRLGGFNSPHDNSCVVMAFADGSVKDISQSVAWGVWSSLGNRADAKYMWQY